MVKLGMGRDDEIDSNVEDSLHAAAFHDDLDVFESCIERGDSLNERRPEFNDSTPIHIACINRSEDFLDKAMEHDFDPWIMNGAGLRAIDIARTQGLSEVQRQLLDKMYPGAHGRQPDLMHIDL